MIGLENTIIVRVRDQILTRLKNGLIEGEEMCIYKTQIKYNKDCLYLWKSDDFLDYFLVSKGKIVCFNTKEEFDYYVNSNQLVAIDEGTVIEIMPRKELGRLQQEDAQSFCYVMLDIWNLAIDVKNSFTSENNILDGHKKLYDKLFFGCNLENSNTSNSKYIPSFSTLENRQIKAIINEAYKWFDAKLEQL